MKGSDNCLVFCPGTGGNLGGWFYMNGSSYPKWRENVMVLTLAGQFWQVNLSQLLQDFLRKMLDTPES